MGKEVALKHLDSWSQGPLRWHWPSHLSNGQQEPLTLASSNGKRSVWMLFFKPPSFLSQLDWTFPQFLQCPIQLHQEIQFQRAWSLYYLGCFSAFQILRASPKERQASVWGFSLLPFVLQQQGNRLRTAHRHLFQSPLLYIPDPEWMLSCSKSYSWDPARLQHYFVPIFFYLFSF